MSALNMGVMQDNVATMLARTDQAANIRLAIIKAQEYYEGKEWWFNESRMTITASVAQAQYTLSDSVVAILKVVYTQGSSKYQLTPISEQERMDLDSPNLTGIPSKYSVYGKFLIPYPAPNSTYLLEVAHTRKKITLSATADTNDWCTYANSLIEARAAWWVAQNVLYDNDAAQAFKFLEADEAARIDRKNTERDVSGIVSSEW